MRENKIKKFWREHSKAICCVGAVIAGSALVVASMTKANDDMNESEEDNLIENKNYDGRDCLMTFTVEDTGEVLWKERCTESYVEDTKRWGMEYEEVRKLNGLE